MKKFVISFQSKVDLKNAGFLYRNRKVGFSSVPTIDRAYKFKTKPEALRIKADLEVREGEWYTFEINEVA